MARMPFVPESYGGGRSVSFESQRLINLYPELATGPGARGVGMLVGTPGLRQWYTGKVFPTRALMAFNNLLYAVVSNKLISIDANGQFIAELGTLQTAGNRVSMRNNGLAAAGVGGNQICIVDGVAGYVYDVVANTFGTIASAGFPATPQQLEYIDGYFVVTDGTMSSYTSNLNNGLVWNALTKNPVQTAPDLIQVARNLHQQLFFIKQYTTEVYYNTGTPTSQGSPFARVSGAIIDFGTPAPWSAARGNNCGYFLASQRNDDGGSFVGVVELNGYTPTVISPPDITYRMGKSTDLTQCFGYFYYDEGHAFYVVTNPVDNWTYVFDTTTRKWHERSTSVLTSSEPTRHLSNCYVYFNGKHLVGDKYTSDLYEMNSKYLTDAGKPIISEHITQHMFDGEGLEVLNIGQLQMDLEAGVGLTDVSSPATATATLAGTSVSACTVTYSGADYTIAPTVLFKSIDGNGAGAAAYTTIVHGSVLSITVTNGGSGYVYPPTVTLVVPEVVPSVGLTISRDGGHTWGSEHIRSMGRVGEYRTRAIWRGVGNARDRVFRFRISSPVKKIILGYNVDAEQ